MSTNYPVMQILGYERIDPEVNALVTEPYPLTFYPTAQTASVEPLAKPKVAL